MHRIERVFVYGLLVASFVWSASRAHVATAADVGGNAGAALSGAPAAMTVTELRVVDAAGKVVARIGSDADGGLIHWYGKTGTGRGELAMSAFGAYAATANKDGKTTSFLGTMADATSGYLGVFDGAGKRRISLVGGEKGGFANFLNPQDQVVAYAGTATDTGGGLISVSTPKGQRNALVAGAAEGGYFATWNVDQKQTTFVGSTADGVGSVNVHRKDGSRAGALAP